VLRQRANHDPLRRRPDQLGHIEGTNPTRRRPKHARTGSGRPGRVDGFLSGLLAAPALFTSPVLPLPQLLRSLVQEQTYPEVPLAGSVPARSI